MYGVEVLETHSLDLVRRNSALVCPPGLPTVRVGLIVTLGFAEYELGRSRGLRNQLSKNEIKALDNNVFDPATPENTVGMSPAPRCDSSISYTTEEPRHVGNGTSPTANRC